MTFAMQQFLLSTLLSFAGLAAALSVAAAAGVLFFRSRERRAPLAYGGLAAVYCLLAAGNLLRQQDGLACALPDGRALALQALLFALMLWFLRDLMRRLRQISA